MDRKLGVVIAISASMLTACVSYGEMRERSPLISLATGKTADSYIGCISPKFADINPKSTTVRDGMGWVVTLPTEGAIGATVTITPTASGAGVEYRQMHRLTTGGWGEAQAAVRDCQ